MDISLKRFDITLAGESNLDLLLYGLPEALPLERELLADRMALTLGGSPAITAHNLAVLGSTVGFVTSSADDSFASACLRDLSAAGIDLSRVVPSPAGVGTGVTIMLQHQASRRSFTYPGSIGALSYEDLDLDYLKSARHFHLSSFFLQRRLMQDVPRLFAELKAAGLTISLDTNDDPSGRWTGPIDEALRYVDILMPNEREACSLAGESSVDAAAARLAELVPLLIVKRGSRGAAAFCGRERLDVEGLPVVTVDAVGAGDSFNAGFLHGYIHGWPLERCLRMGNLCGAFSTTGAGGISAFQSRPAMEEFFASRIGSFDHECEMLVDSRPNS